MENGSDERAAYGAGLALCANQQAAACFERMSPEEQRQVVEGTHAIQSPAEMRAYVASLVR